MKALVYIVATAAMLAVAPAFAEPARIVVPAHDIPRGVTIADSDLAYQMVTPESVRAGIVTSMNDLDGMETRRFLRAGETVRPDDVRHPIVVTKGTTVTLTFDMPGLSLTAIGKAMSEGGVGDTVTVLNPVSYRQITGVVTGPGAVRAGDTGVVIQPDRQIAAVQPAPAVTP